MKNPINIAVVVAGIDEEYQNTILLGIQDFAAEKKNKYMQFYRFRRHSEKQTA